MVGCSLDGDVEDFAGIVEIKCPKSATHYGYLKANGGVPATTAADPAQPVGDRRAVVRFRELRPAHPAQLRLFVVRVPRVDLDVLAYEKCALKFLDEVRRGSARSPGRAGGVVARWRRILTNSGALWIKQSERGEFMTGTINGNPSWCSGTPARRAISRTGAC
jgi:hypothetical protein